MNKTVAYFINLIKDQAIYSNTQICIKNFKTDMFGNIYWDESDHPPMNAKHVSILGVSYNFFNCYFNISDQSSPVRRSHKFQWPWSKWGNFTFNIDDIKDGLLASYLENVFLQMMHEVEHGQNVFIGNELFIEKNTAYQHMMKIDLMDIE